MATGAAPAGATNEDGRILRGRARRESILRAAAREFGRRGYDATRVVDVARSAGVSDAGLLHHFPTKLDLFQAVVERREDAYADAAAAEVDTVRGLFDALTAAARRASEEPDLLRFRVMLAGAAATSDHPAAQRLEDNLRAALALLVPVVERGIAAGELRAETDARQLVLELLALNDGIRSQWAILPEEVDFARVFAAAVDALYARTRAPRTPGEFT